DRRERLAAEPETRDREEVLLPRQLARRVAVEREERVLPPHPAPVVRDPDLGLPAVLDRDVDPCGGRVQRVLDQLLDDRGRTLHALARRDLVRERVRENVYTTRHRLSSAHPGSHAPDPPPAGVRAASPPLPATHVRPAARVPPT